MTQDPKELKCEMEQKVLKRFNQEGALEDFIIKTMDNFNYRYLETELSPDVKTQNVAPGVFLSVSFENKMKSALETNQDLAKLGITELAKNIPKKDNPFIRYTLSTEVLEWDNTKGKLRVMSSINWDFPSFENQNKQVFQCDEYLFEDILELRNKYAKWLEKVCAIF